MLHCLRIQSNYLQYPKLKKKTAFSFTGDRQISNSFKRWISHEHLPDFLSRPSRSTAWIYIPWPWVKLSINVIVYNNDVFEWIVPDGYVKHFGRCYFRWWISTFDCDNKWTRFFIYIYLRYLCVIIIIMVPLKYDGWTRYHSFELTNQQMDAIKEMLIDPDHVSPSLHHVSPISSL